MSQQPRPAAGGGGSVRRARERMQAGLPPEMPAPPKPVDPMRSNPNTTPPRVRPQMPQAFQGVRNGAGAVGVAISRPTPVAQWPLAATIENTTDQAYQPPAGKSVAPQRPPRPSHVPSMLDASRLQEHTPAFQYKPQGASQQQREREAEDDQSSPIITSPTTQSSRPSTISSVGTIPDFPMPIPAQPTGLLPRRSGNPGPPPISRRGVSSYYSQASFISPIPEESPRAQISHGSYASSAAIPSSWGSDSPGYPFDEEDEAREKGFGHEPIEEGRESRESNGDENEGRGLIRNASLGKRAKPSMITTKSVEKVEPARPAPRPQQKSKLERMGIIDGGIIGGATGMVAGRPNGDGQKGGWPIVGSPTSPLAGGTGFIESSSEESVPQVARGIVKQSGAAPDSTAQAVDPRASIAGAYSAASALPAAQTSRLSTAGQGFSRLSAIRRPPRLNIDAVRDAEARGSLTSLPDLIKRATKLAAMMDRGRRPASRMNDLNDFPDMSDIAREKEMGLVDEKRQSNFSGMLAAFPPPGLATPTPNRDSPRPVSWPPAPSDLDLTSSNKPRRRRCCGLPCWAFLLLSLLILLIIAAAVVVPLELLVFHKIKTHDRSAAVTPLQSCAQAQDTTCQNGGTSFLAPTNMTTDSLNTNSCSCICINGFTGPTCAISGATGCTTISSFSSSSSDSSDSTASPTTYDNVTLGTAIPRLISDAQANFSIPLFEPVIIARFNAANLSCVSENALVTFDGESSRMGRGEDVVVALPVSGSKTGRKVESGAEARRLRMGRRELEQFASSFSTTFPAVPAATPSPSNGIVVDPNPAPTPSPSPSRSPSRSPSPSTSYSQGPAAASESQSSPPSSTPTPTVSPTAAFTLTEQTLDFARVATLFILQQMNLDAAVVAQGSLMQFFGTISSDHGGTGSDSGSGNGGNGDATVVTNHAAGNVSLGSVQGVNVGWVDLVKGRVGLGNGTVWGEGV